MSPHLVTLFFIFCLTYILKKIYDNYQTFKHITSLPGFLDSHSFWWGHIYIAWKLSKDGYKGLEILSKIFDSGFEEKYQKAGDVAVWMGNMFLGAPIFVPTRVEMIKLALVTNKILEKGSTYKIIQAVIGNNLLSMGHRDWLIHRPVLNKSFKHDRMKVIIYNFRQSIDRFQSTIRNNSTIESFQNVAADLIVNNIFETLFGLKFERDSRELRQCLDRGIEIMSNYPQSSYSFTSSGRELRHNVGRARDIIESSIQDFDDLNNDKELLITDLFESVGNKIKMSDFKSELLLFLLEAYDTTANTLSFVLINMCKYPEMQEEVYQDIRSIHDHDGDISTSKLLDCFYKETLRMWNVLQSFGRQTSEDVTCNIDGLNIKIPNGSQVPIYLKLIHRSTLYWSHPNEFNPKRFLNRVVPHSFLPFSLGKRDCIGKTYATKFILEFVSKLLLEYQIESPDLNVIMREDTFVRRLDRDASFSFKKR